MSANGGERKLAAILSADVVAYSRLMAENEDATVRTLRDYRDELGLLVRQHRGRVVDTAGDSLLAEFPTATDAVRAGVEIQGVVAVRNAALPAERRMQFRIGVHMGEVRVEEDRIYGDGVNIAARLEALAEPGGICISGSVHEQVRHRLDRRFEDLGEHEVKNIPDPVRVFRIETAPEVAPAAVSRPARRALLAAGLVAILGAAALVGWRMLAGPSVAPTASELAAPIRSIAVLPLENLSGDPAQDYFADGMTEALISDIAKLGSLRVISRTSAMRYKNSQKSLPEIARELDVDAIVEGTALREGDRVRITAQLIDARRDAHLWAESYERDFGSALAVQGEVAEAVAREIELTVTPRPEARASTRSVDPQAFEAYLKGRYHWNRRTEADLRKAIEYFEVSIAREPDWALGHAGLADAYVILPSYYSTDDPREVMPKARAAALRALELDESLAQAHAALGAVRIWYEWDWTGAEAEFRRALELDPSYATAHHWYSIHLAAGGRDWLAHAERARELDPLSMIISTNVGSQYFFARDYDRSIETMTKALEFDPSFEFGLRFLSRAYAEKSMHDDAVATAERLGQVNPSPRNLGNLAYVYARAGRREDALRIVEDLRGPGLVPFDVAVVYAALGDLDAAFEWLEKAHERRASLMSALHLFPELDPLRSDPRFDDLARRVGFEPS